MMITPEKKTALVVEGGGMRAIFTAGVLDAFLDADFDPFDMYLGVSGGALTLSSYLARQYTRYYRIFTEIAYGPELFSFKRMLTGGSYIDLDWLWNAVEAVMPLDTRAIDINLMGKECYIVSTQVDTGLPAYLSPQGREWINMLKASSALPILYRHFPVINGIPMTDGGITDPVPVKEAYDRGARHIVVIRTRPMDAHKTSRISPLIGALFFKKYPNLKEKFRNQAQCYNSTVDFMLNPPDDLTITQISPQSIMKTKRTRTHIDALNSDYADGVAMGQKALKTLNPMNLKYSDYQKKTCVN